jgi:hypothetical protein
MKNGIAKAREGGRNDIGRHKNFLFRNTVLFGAGCSPCVAHLRGWAYLAKTLVGKRHAEYVHTAQMHLTAIYVRAI